MLFKVRVTPNAKKPGVAKAGEDGLEVRVDERPAEGRANKRLCELLAEHFDIQKSKVTIVRGARSRDKIVEVILD